MIYIGTDEGIYRWLDKTFWPAFHSLQNRAVVSLAAPAPAVLAAVDNDGRVWESTSNGIEWVEVPMPEKVTRPLAVAAGGSARLILLTTKPMGLYRREVGAPISGAPDLESGPPHLLKRLLAGARISGSGSTALLPKHAPKQGEVKGPDAWIALPTPSAQGQGILPTIRTIVAAAGDSNPWYAALTGAGLWRTEDSGSSWQQCPGLPADVYAIRTVVKPAELVVVGTSDGVWSSSDRGRTWVDRSGGLEKVRQIRALELHPEDPSSMLAGAAPASAADTPRTGTRFALYESADGGKSWSHVVRGFPDVLQYDTITDIRYDPAAPVNAIVALESGELWRSRNGGDWWEPIARQIRVARVLCATV